MAYNCPTKTVSITCTQRFLTVDAVDAENESLSGYPKIFWRALTEIEKDCEKGCIVISMKAPVAGNQRTLSLVEVINTEEGEITTSGSCTTCADDHSTEEVYNRILQCLESCCGGISSGPLTQSFALSTNTASVEDLSDVEDVCPADASNVAQAATYQLVAGTEKNLTAVIAAGGSTTITPVPIGYVGEASFEVQLLCGGSPVGSAVISVTFA